MIIFGSIILLSLHSISYVQGCAPYFQTVPWQRQAYLLNNSVTCDSTFKNPDPDVTVTGERYCFEVFVGRAFANWVCTQACKNQNLMKIDCSKFSWTGQGLDPSAITFSISCSYAGGGVCAGNTYTWAQAESEWYKHCKAGRALGVGPYGNGKLGYQNDVSNSNNGGLMSVVRAGGNMNSNTNTKNFNNSNVKRKNITINTHIENTNVIIIDGRGRPIKMISQNGSTINLYNNSSNWTSISVIAPWMAPSGITATPYGGVVTGTVQINRLNPEQRAGITASSSAIDILQNSVDRQVMETFQKTANRQIEALAREQLRLQETLERINQQQAALNDQLKSVRDLVDFLIKRQNEAITLVPPGPLSPIVSPGDISSLLNTFNRMDQATIRQLLNRIANLEDQLRKSIQQKIDTENDISDLRRNFESDIAKLRDAFDRRLKELDARKADRNEIKQAKFAQLNLLEQRRYGYLDDLKNKIDQLDRIERSLNDLKRRIEILEREHHALTQRVDDSMKEQKSLIQERMTVAREVARIINELNYRARSIEREMNEIRNRLNEARQQSLQQNVPNQQTTVNNQHVISNYNNMYDEHQRLYRDLVTTINRLIQAFQQNQPQIRAPPDQFNENLWQNLLEKLNDAKAAASTFHDTHRMLHQTYNTDTRVSNSVKQVYQFFYMMGDKNNGANVPQLVDPATLKINESEKPQILDVEIGKNTAGDNLPGPDDPNRPIT